MEQFRGNPYPTVADLARLTDLSRATVMRFLITLEEEGYVARDENRWSLTSKTLELGFAALESLGITEVVQTIVQALADEVLGTANIGEHHPEGVLIIARALAPAQRRRLHVANLRVGSILPSNSALYQALKMSPGTQHASQIYPPVHQISFAVRIPNNSPRVLSLAISTNQDELDTQEKQEQQIAILHEQAVRIGQIIDMGPI